MIRFYFSLLVVTLPESTAPELNVDQDEEVKEMWSFPPPTLSVPWIYLQGKVSPFPAYDLFQSLIQQL